MREAPKISPTQDQLDIYGQLGASPDEVRQAEGQSLQAVTHRIKQLIAERIRPFKVGAVVERQGQRGVVTKRSIHLDQTTGYDDIFITFYWYNNQKYEAAIKSLAVALSNIQSTGEYDEAIVQQEGSELCLKKRIDSLRDQFGIFLIPAKTTRDRSRVQRYQEYIEYKTHQAVTELTDDELDTHLLHIFHNLKSYWREMKE